MPREFLATVAGSPDRTVTVAEVEGSPGRYAVSIGERRLVVDARPLEAGVQSLLVGGDSYTVEVDAKPPDFAVSCEDWSVAVKLVDARRQQLAETAARAAGSAAHGPTLVRSPMPGKVVKILGKPGDSVAAGAGIVVVEAMKMENELGAPRAGKIKRILVKESQAVESGEELVEIE